MPRVHALLEALGLATCEKARRALTGDIRFGEVLLDVSKTALDYIQKSLTQQDFHLALTETAALNRESLNEKLGPILDGLARIHSMPFRSELREYLLLFPGTIRHFLARPSDPTGKTIPETASFHKPEEFLRVIPPRRPHLHETPPGLDHWQLVEPIGFGETDETWRAVDSTKPGAVAAITFVIEEEARKAILDNHQLFLDVFGLTDQTGIVPLRSVYLETNPPAFDSPFLAGFNLSAMMWDWRWRYDTAKPEATLKVMKRLCEIVSIAHEKGIVHRDLKPANIRIHPTEGGKFTIWITNFGWGQIASARSLQLSRNTTPRAEQLRLAMCGAHSSVYASPQQTKKEAPDPRDDVYALGVIWYQLLRRDPHALPPVGTEWAEEFAAAGVTDSQAHLLSACLSTRPDKRPENAARLRELMSNVTLGTPGPSDGSKLIPLKGKSGEHPTGWDILPTTQSTKPQAPLSGKMRLAAIASSAPRSGKISIQAVKAAAASTAGIGYGGLPKMVNNSIGMTFALIPPGNYMMGSPPGETGRREHESPLHPVTISKPFYMSIFPVTQEYYEKIMGKNPSAFVKGHGVGPDNPVESVSWQESVAFCERLTRLNEEQTHARWYRLPTEAEWEYACRAGTTKAYSCGDKFTPTDGHYASAGAYGKTGGEGHTVAVGRFDANGFGLYDMHSNIMEWCSDWYDEYYYFDSPEKDPQGPEKGTLKVVRGGCWMMFPSECRSASRRGHDPASHSNTIGFRIVLAMA